jgi:DNA-binding NarL/FixJ family response regulator
MDRSSERVRVLVVDDDAEIRSLLQIFLETDGSFHIVGNVGRAEEALSVARAENPDVVLLDLALAGVAGLDVAEALLAADPDLPIVVFSAFLHPSAVAAAERMGVRACLDKREIGLLPNVLIQHAEEHTRAAD